MHNKLKVLIVIGFAFISTIIATSIFDFNAKPPRVQRRVVQYINAQINKLTKNLASLRESFSFKNTITRNVSLSPQNRSFAVIRPTPSPIMYKTTPTVFSTKPNSTLAPKVTEPVNKEVFTKVAQGVYVSESKDSNTVEIKLNSDVEFLQGETIMDGEKVVY